MKRYGSQRTHFPLAVLSASLSYQPIKFPALEIRFNLPVPHPRIKLEKPHPKFGQIFRGTLCDRACGWFYRTQGHPPYDR